MSWRRLAPWVIGVIALVAIFIDIPRVTVGRAIGLEGEAAAEWLPSEVLGAEFRTVLGLDLKGGLRVTLQAQREGDEPITDEQLELARTIIERRVAGIGVSEPQ